MDVLKKTDKFRYEIPISYKDFMRVPGLIFASEKLLNSIVKEQVYDQVANVASLPGIVKYSIGMPDIHWGYGLPIGGVAAVSIEDGVISPGGVGSDINCGVRLMKTGLRAGDVNKKIEKLVDDIYSEIPAGIGQSSTRKLSVLELTKLIENGSSWALEMGWGVDGDLENTEERGCLKGSDKDNISKNSIERGLKQIGTLGAGNHFIEVQRVDEIYDEGIAASFGIEKDYVVIMIHTGSRGFGYQICADYMQKMQSVVKKYDIKLPDRQLAAAPINSPEGKQYISAMSAAANYAWVNRQVIMHKIRGILENEFGKNIDTGLIYDVAHNIAKFEEHEIDGRKKKLCVHRKGATRAFAPGHKDLKELYKSTGQPVIIPGDMGTESFLLTGTEKAMQETFGTVCHGAGRLLSRKKAVVMAKGKDIYKELRDKNIVIKSRDWRTLAEEMPDAYKDVGNVVDVIAELGFAKKIAKLKPMGVIKG